MSIFCFRVDAQKLQVGVRTTTHPTRDETSGTSLPPLTGLGQPARQHLGLRKSPLATPGPPWGYWALGWKPVLTGRLELGGKGAAEAHGGHQAGRVGTGGDSQGPGPELRGCVCVRKASCLWLSGRSRQTLWLVSAPIRLSRPKGGLCLSFPACTWRRDGEGGKKKRKRRGEKGVKGRGMEGEEERRRGRRRDEEGKQEGRGGRREREGGGKEIEGEKRGGRREGGGGGREERRGGQATPGSPPGLTHAGVVLLHPAHRALAAVSVGWARACLTGLVTSWKAEMGHLSLCVNPILSNEQDTNVISEIRNLPSLG